MRRMNPVVWLLLVFMALQGAAVVSAKGPPGVANGKHNLSSSAPVAMYATDEEEICVFCHTPHGGSLTAPLWNKPNTTQTFTQYTTDTPALQNAGRPVSDESLICLSCHDGTLSVNSVINLANYRYELYPEDPRIYTLATGSPDTPIVWGFGGNNPVLGTDLSNDHPISFSYNSVITHYNNTGRAGKLHVVGDALDAGVRFFGADNYVECSTCHDPHVDYSASGDPTYAPFLIMPNTGSDLCLACHNK